MCSQGGAQLDPQHDLGGRFQGVWVGAEHQYARRPAGGGPKQSSGAHLQWDVLWDVGGADLSGNAPPGPGLHRHLQRVRQWLECGCHPCARGELGAIRTDGGRASIRVVGDGGVHQEDVIRPTDEVETGSGASVVPPPTEPNVVPSEGEQPLSSLIKP